MEKKLEVLKKALELGAKINIAFHGNESLDQAREKAETIANGLGLEAQYSINEDDNTMFERFMTDNYGSQINVNSYFTTYKKKEETA